MPLGRQARALPAAQALPVQARALPAAQALPVQTQAQPAAGNLLQRPLEYPTLTEAEAGWLHLAVPPDLLPHPPQHLAVNLLQPPIL